MLSPNAQHSYNGNTDSDEDTVSGIGPGSPFLYVLYSSTRGSDHCHNSVQHRAIFDAAIEALQCAMSEEVAFPVPGGGGGGYGSRGEDGFCESVQGDCDSLGGVVYGSADLPSLTGGSGGGGGSDDGYGLEGAGGGGSGGAIHIVTPTLSLAGALSAVGGDGGVDDCCGGRIINDGGDGGDGRIKLETDNLDIAGTATMTPLPGSMPRIPYVANMLFIASGETVTLNTDGYTSFMYTSLNIESGGKLTAVGSQPLNITVSENCTIAGTIDVSGGAGDPGQDQYSGGGGGAGGGAVELTCGTVMSIPGTGSVLANGGAGGRSNIEDGSSDGMGGLGIAGGYDGGRGSQWALRAARTGGDGSGPGGGYGSQSSRV